jgi:hypothetical protein
MVNVPPFPDGADEDVVELDPLDPHAASPPARPSAAKATPKRIRTDIGLDIV